jgi:putative hydrolase of the HAD superfamily
MIKAVFFDFYNTLATFAPSREELQRQALQEFGMDAPLPLIRLGYPEADRLWAEEQGRWPLDQRPADERDRVFIAYEQRVLQHTGLRVPDEVALAVFRRLLEVSGQWMLFDDAIPTLESLRERGLTTGIISNVVGGLDQALADLGLDRHIGIIVTSDQVGATKPDPRIFEEALRRARVAPNEALFVGDQVESDVSGAWGAGMTPLLLDRDGVYSELTDVPLVASLLEVVEYVEAQGV